MADDKSRDESSPPDAPEDSAPEGAGAPDEVEADKPAGASEAPPTRYRRWHTLSGAIALAVFLIEHLVTNASALGGQASYDAVLGAMERSALLPFIEIVFILLPLGFHAGYGVYLLRQKSTDDRVIARYGDRRLWVVQRLSAVFVLAFVAGHFIELRLQRLAFGLSADGLHSTLAAHLSSTWAGVPWVALLYLVGLFATAVHLANGLFAATHAWGIGVDPAGRRRMRIALTALGALLFVIGTASVVALATGGRLFGGGPELLPCGTDMPAPLPAPKARGSAPLPSPAASPSR